MMKAIRRRMALNKLGRISSEILSETQQEPIEVSSP